MFEIDAKDQDPFEAMKEVPWKEISKVYHLGAITDTTCDDIELLFRLNIKFSIDLMTKALEWEIPVRYASSASVYGNSRERYLINPLNYYALSKATVDQWVNNVGEGDIIGLRYFNVYGEDESMKAPHTQSGVYKFIQQAKEKRVIKLFVGSSEMYRDFVCVDDVIDVTLNVPGVTRPRIIDVGTGKPISFEKLAEIIRDKYDARLDYMLMPDELRNQYQYYTSSRPHVKNYPFMSVSGWLSKRDIKISIA